jgi:hypothetical protein
MESIILFRALDVSSLVLSASGEDGLQIWRVAANILNKQSRTADKGWCSSFLAWGYTTAHRKNKLVTEEKKLHEWRGLKNGSAPRS